MREEFVDVYKAFAEKYGVQSQCLQCIEEMSELTKELCKLERYRGTKKELEIVENIKEELADVLNMAEQLAYIFGADEIEQIRDNKIKKSKSLYF